MFVLTALVYPGVLAVLCLGAGLLVERCSGVLLPGLLLPPVGAAALIAVSQLTTYVSFLAPATPYAIAVVAVAGLALGWRRVQTLMRGLRARRLQIALPLLAYLIALAPVLLAGRPTFSSYMALADSAVHMLGADFLMRHGQDYSHLDLRNSYGQFINAYYNTSYPSGSDTLFGGSAFLLRLPLIWAFQPFNAFMLAIAAGPAWLLVRRMGLDGGLGRAGRALCNRARARLRLRADRVDQGDHRAADDPHAGRPRRPAPALAAGGPAGAIPFALVVAAGVSALGVGFGAWVLAAVVVLLAVVIGDVAAGARRARRSLLLVGAGAIGTLVSAWPTWIDVSGSLQVAQNIASTTNSGNLHTPLRLAQVFGTWLRGSYKLLPAGGHLELTYALIAITLLGALLGVLHIVRAREYPLAGWLALMLAVWLGLTAYSTTWVDAKALMLTSPVVVLLAWGGLAAPRASPLPPLLRRGMSLLALALAGGVLASDAMQYHSSNLAPTARYQEMASLNTRFAGRGPTLFTDFDEYALYELRDLDVGGPDFAHPPVALAGIARGYGYPVNLDRAPPAALRSYPLIVTRRDPAASRPPSAYRLLWQGTYYQVWGRRAGAPAAIVHLGLSGALPPSARASSAWRRSRAPLVRSSSPPLLRSSCGSRSPAPPCPPAGAKPAAGARNDAARPALGRLRGAPCRRLGVVASGGPHACCAPQRGRPPPCLDRRPARRQLAHRQHDDPRAGPALGGTPSPVDHPRRLQPRPRRRRSGGTGRRLPYARRRRRPGHAPRGTGRPLALAVRTPQRLDRGRPRLGVSAQRLGLRSQDAPTPSMNPPGSPQLEPAGARPTAGAAGDCEHYAVAARYCIPLLSIGA